MRLTMESSCHPREATTDIVVRTLGAHAVPLALGESLGVRDGIAYFEGGRLRADHEDLTAPPEPWMKYLMCRGSGPQPWDDASEVLRMKQTWICGAVVFERVVRALRLAEHAREILAVERAVAAERTQGAPLRSEPQAPAATPEDGPLDVTAATALRGPGERPLVSRSTLYRLLAVVPAPITVGGARKDSARWPDRAAFEAWLLRAGNARRLALRGGDPKQTERTNSTGKRRAAKTEESPGSGSASWEARRRARKEKGR